VLSIGSRNCESALHADDHPQSMSLEAIQNRVTIGSDTLLQTVPLVTTQLMEYVCFVQRALIVLVVQGMQQAVALGWPPW
jgi:hypothetical protein